MKLLWKHLNQFIILLFIKLISTEKEPTVDNNFNNGCDDSRNVILGGDNIE